MLLDVVLLTTTVWGIHQYHVKLVLVGIVQHIPRQRVVVIDVGRVNIVQQHIGHTQHVGELLFLDTVDGTGIFLLVFSRLDFLIKCFEPAGEKATRTTGKVSHLLANLGLDDFSHEIGQGTRRIEFTGSTCRLHFLQDALINLTKGVALLVVPQI